MDERVIGIFDSGVGGLTIWRAIRDILPRERLIFLADSRHAPYGEKSPGELFERTRCLTAFLIECGAKLIVVACNTATVHVIDHLRAAFPSVPFVGVVPVVKTLARETRTGTIAILSTPATAASPYLAALIRTFAPDKRVINVACPGLADLVEAGDVDCPGTLALLGRHLAAVRESPADVVGLGCTHYPFLRRQIEGLLDPAIRIYDPAVPVARRVVQLLADGDAFGDSTTPEYRFYTTGIPEQFVTVARTLLDVPVPAAECVTL